MTKLVIQESGKVVDLDKADLADRIIELRKKKDPWVVIDELVKYWVDNSPEEVEATKINITDQREILIDKEFGQTTGGKDFERRVQLIFPTSLLLLVRSVYPNDELIMDRQFYRDFAKRYPGFRIAEKD